MRYIDTSSINVPNNWVVLAKEGGFNPLWSYFKKDFEALVGKKCWYSESEIYASINPVDHFRPQGGFVAKLTSKNADLEESVWKNIDNKKRVGYSFLKLTFSNYRYVCAISNSLTKDSGIKAKGKSNFFPLKNGSSYGTNEIDIGNEVFCLLDPCVQQHVECLYFKDSGLIEPHLSILSNSWDYCRVKSTIELYHLHYDKFIEKRKILWNKCKDHIEIADVLYKKINKSSEDAINLAYHIKELKIKIRKDEQFSAVAIDCIKHFKKIQAYFWMDHYFPDQDLIK